MNDFSFFSGHLNARKESAKDENVLLLQIYFFNRLQWVCTVVSMDKGTKWIGQFIRDRRKKERKDWEDKITRA